MKHILFTHDDLDGMGCKMVFTLFMNIIGETDFEVVICGNSTVNDIVNTRLAKDDISVDTNIYFSDICPEFSTVSALVNSNFNIQIWDHHASNVSFKDIVINSIITPEGPTGRPESATSIMYQFYIDAFLNNNAVKNSKMYLNLALLDTFVDNVRMWDTYAWKEVNDIMPRKLNVLFSLIGPDNFYKKYMGRIMDRDSGTELINENDMVFIDSRLNNEQRLIDNFIEKGEVFDIMIPGEEGKEYRCALVVEAIACNFSELAHQFLARNPQYDIMTQFSMFYKGTFSLRTVKDDINVAAIAERMGGGGHPKAAGSNIPTQIYNAFADIISKKLQMKEFKIIVMEP